MGRPSGAPLWRHQDFLKLWVGQTVSKLGSGISGSALPLTALLVLGAGPTAMGLLSAASIVPVVCLGLVAGVWVDRLRRRPVMIGADLGRALLLATIPAAALTGRLGMGQLFVVAAGAGALTVFFDVAYQSFVPDLVGRRRVLEANSKLAASEAVAEITTPGLAGVLVATITAPMAVLLDALSFLGSALSVALVRTPERAPAPPGSPGRDVGREIAAGLRVVAGSPFLRAIALYAAVEAFFGSFIGTLYALYALRELGLGPVLLGITIGVGGASNLLGTFLVEPVTRRFGPGRTMLGAVGVGTLAVFLIPLAGLAAASGAPERALAVGFAFLVAGQAFDAIHPLYQVNALTVRQSVAPETLLGRVNASMRVLEGGAAPLGALVGGLLGDSIGVRPTLFVAAAGLLANALWLARSPLRRLGRLPPPAPEPVPAGV
jgi:MFS family permease